MFPASRETMACQLEYPLLQQDIETSICFGLLMQLETCFFRSSPRNSLFSTSRREINDLLLLFNYHTSLTIVQPWSQVQETCPHLDHQIYLLHLMESRGLPHLFPQPNMLTIVFYYKVFIATFKICQIPHFAMVPSYGCPAPPS